MAATKVTRQQERLIAELRREGMGYKAIASAAGLSRDAVRYFCKAHPEVDPISDDNGDAQCPNCGKAIQQPRTGRRRRFCGESCRRAWWGGHPDARRPNDHAVYCLTCAHCGKLFDSYGNQSRRYCCRSCYFAARFLTKSI